MISSPNTLWRLICVLERHLEKSNREVFVHFRCDPKPIVYETCGFCQLVFWKSLTWNWRECRGPPPSWSASAPRRSPARGGSSEGGGWWWLWCDGDCGDDCDVMVIMLMVVMRMVTVSPVACDSFRRRWWLYLFLSYKNMMVLVARTSQLCAKTFRWGMHIAPLSAVWRSCQSNINASEQKEISVWCKTVKFSP